MSKELYRSSRDVKIIYNDGTAAYDLDGFWQSLSIDGSTSTVTRRLNLDFINTEDGREPLLDIKHGKEIRLLVDGGERFRGVVVKDEMNNEGMASLTAYDYNWYLQKNTASLKFSNMTASDIIERISSLFEIPIGEIDDTGYKFKRLIFEEKTLYEMIVTALTETEKHTGETYRLYSDRGRLCLKRRTQTFNWTVIEEGRNLLSATHKQSIEDTITQVKVENDSEELSAKVRRQQGVEDYGLLQHYETTSEAKTSGELKALARQILRNNQTVDSEFKVEALGIWGVEAGTGVAIRESMSGVYGGYYVTADKHNYSASGMHTMSLKLQKTPDIDRIEYEEE